MAPDKGKTLPENLDAERAVLAALILDGEVVDEALALLGDGSSFRREAHRRIYAAISELNAHAIPVDQLSLADRLESNGDLDRVGGKAYIIELANNSFAIYNWQHHAEIVKRMALLRDLISAADHISSLAQSNPDDAATVVEDAEKLLFNATSKRLSSNFIQLGDLLDEVSGKMEEMASSQTHIQGVPTGFPSLDHLLAGMRAGDLIVLAARPGIGKSALALNIALNAAREGTTVAFFSLEMPAAQLAQRIIASQSSVKATKIRDATLTQADWGQIVEAISRVYSYEFYIDDSPGLSLLELRAKARRQLRNARAGLIVVDYLQLMQSKASQLRDRWLEVGEISRGLKVLAKELGMPIVALSQLNRAVEGRKDKRPQLADLRESGSIEQDADVVMFIDRSTSEEEALLPGRPGPGMAKLIVGKNRNGATKDIDLLFDETLTRFLEMDTRHQDDV
ncbi:MAG: replicative DNA helicase [Coriobacteriales bacterium]|jgi:replicative DNA helicase|nr:replicative DNA helicase [Coriobacteriales bacterium]